MVASNVKARLPAGRCATNDIHTPAEQAPRARVVIVDGFPIFRAGLVGVLARAPDFLVAGMAGTVAEARRLVAEASPDLVVLDVDIAGGDGLELIKCLRALHEGVSFLVVSALDEDAYAERAIRAGVLRRPGVLVGRGCGAVSAPGALVLALAPLGLAMLLGDVLDVIETDAQWIAGVLAFLLASSVIVARIGLDFGWGGLGAGRGADSRRAPLSGGLADHDGVVAGGTRPFRGARPVLARPCVCGHDGGSVARWGFDGLELRNPRGCRRAANCPSHFHASDGEEIVLWA